MSRQRDLTILDAMADPKLFGRWFGGPSWRAWKVFLAALFGLPLTKPQLALYQRHTGRRRPPRAPAREAWLPVGRRGGKSIIAALIAVFLAFFRDYSKFLAPGERATVMVIAADRRQARVVFRYITGLIDHVPMLARMVENRTRDAIDLTNRVTIEVHTCSYRAIRGYTIAAAICDEIAFWRSEDAANPDVEVLNGLRPGMATIPGALLLAISSPYARRGALWEAHKKHYGKDRDPVLVWQADTRSMNPTIDKRTVAEAYEQDPAVAEADYGAKFRRDIERLFPREAVEAASVPDRRELPPNPQLQYVAFCDPSGGSEDSFTLAIAHLENGRSVLDAIRERRPPFSPDEVVGEFAASLSSYGINRVSGDRYAGEWPRERFRAHGILYQPASKSKSEIYAEFIPLVNSERVELLDHPRLFNQVLGLERRVRHGGHSSIDHEPGGHDDLANVAAGVSVDLLAPEEQEIEIEYDPLGLENRITPELDEADGFVPGW
jgi:hypothetical protein